MTLRDTATPPKITVTAGPAAGRSIDLEGEIVVGRENVDLTIDDSELSRRHAILRVSETAVVIEDLGSTNGTFVNERRISTATSIQPSDTIRVGVSQLQLVLPPAPDPPSAAPQTGATTLRTIPDTETTRQRPAPRVPTSEGTVMRPSPPAQQSERTTVRPLASDAEAPSAAAPPDAPEQPPEAQGPPRGLPAPTVMVLSLVVIVAAIAIALASNLSSSKSTHQFSATISASPSGQPQQGQVELTGTQTSQTLGAGTVMIDEFSSPGSGQGTLISARIITKLSAGTLISVVKATATPTSGGESIVGTATVVPGSSTYKHASGTYSISATRKSAGSATIFTLHGSIRY